MKNSPLIPPDKEIHMSRAEFDRRWARAAKLNSPLYHDVVEQLFGEEQERATLTKAEFRTFLKHYMNPQNLDHVWTMICATHKARGKS